MGLCLFMLKPIFVFKMHFKRKIILTVLSSYHSYYSYHSQGFVPTVEKGKEEKQKSKTKQRLQIFIGPTKLVFSDMIDNYFYHHPLMDDRLPTVS